MVHTFTPTAGFLTLWVRAVEATPTEHLPDNPSTARLLLLHTSSEALPAVCDVTLPYRPKAARGAVPG